MAEIGSKLANALFKDAAPNRLASDLIGLSTGVQVPLGTILSGFAAAYGGLWVGGRVRLTSDRLSFAPNAANVAVHENGSELRFDLPLELIDGLAYRKAFFTNIIEVKVAGGTVSFRCFGARDFLTLIEDTRAAKIAALN